ncbi:MAG: hypothetical protein ACRDAM_19275 [Casimicrobium sp.]
MAKKKPRSDTSSGFAIPPSIPRNRIAVNPLLKKSGAHADRRAKAKIQQASADIASTALSRRKLDE